MNSIPTQQDLKKYAAFSAITPNLFNRKEEAMPRAKKKEDQKESKETKAAEEPKKQVIDVSVYFADGKISNFPFPQFQVEITEAFLVVDQEKARTFFPLANIKFLRIDYK